MRVYSHSIGRYFFVQPIGAECWRGRGGKLSRILGKKNTIFKKHPVCANKDKVWDIFKTKPTHANISFLVGYLELHRFFDVANYNEYFKKLNGVQSKIQQFLKY